jgi:hypothetical protein
MHAFFRVLSALLVMLLLTPCGARAQERKWVRGTVTATSLETFTVYVFGLDLNLGFTVVPSTVIVASGGISVRPPEHTKPEFSDIVTRGRVVEVHYTRKGARNQADIIRPAVDDWQEAGTSFVGRVAAVSGGALTVEADGGRQTFAVAPATRVLGSRLGTRRLGDLIGENERVLVLFGGDANTLTATEVFVIRRSR